jgi:hypothetical protein
MIRRREPYGCDALKLSAFETDRLANQFHAFMELADRLNMRRAERAGILAVRTAELLQGAECLRNREDEALRRLGYAMRMMQRQLENLETT